jgi:hypothetical protein
MVTEKKSVTGTKITIKVSDEQRADKKFIRVFHHHYRCMSRVQVVVV